MVFMFSHLHVIHLCVFLHNIEKAVFFSAKICNYRISYKVMDTQIYQKGTYLKGISHTAHGSDLAHRTVFLPMGLLG